MSYVNSILNDLREKRLWPIAVVLLAALVAVPVLLSKSSAKPAPAAPAAPATPPPSSATALPTVNVSSGPGHTSLKGKGRDPFAQLLAHAASSTATGTGSATTSSGTTSTATGGSGTTASSTGGGVTSTTGGSTTGGSTGGSPTTPVGGGTTGPSSPLPPSTKPAPPAPSGLTPTETYAVRFSITNGSGGFDTIDPLERLSVLPSERQARLVELGVLKGGKRVLFMVQPGTQVNGPGTCTPGRIDCQILSLAPNQIESVSLVTANGTTSLASFAVTSIHAVKHPSAAAAAKARRNASAVGRRLVNRSTYDALSLFPYDPSVGALVDLRNLTVGGS
jgi:hypothetical protein